MSATEVLMSASIMVGLAVLRFGIPLLVTWLVGKLLKLAVPAAA